MTEAEFCAVIQWFNAKSGSEAKYNWADYLKKYHPGVEPWNWTTGFRAYLDASKK